MRILRGKEYTTKILAFLFLAFATSSALTLASPRPTYAEGPLLGAVRCLLGTVLLQKCQPATPATTAPANTPASSRSSSGATSSTTKGSSSPNSSSSPAATTQSSSPAGATSFTPPKDAEIALPKDTKPMAPEAQAVATPNSTQPHLTGAEQIAFFNAYSRYARDVQPPQTGAAPLERSDEGWRIMGITWYWWVVLVLGGAVAFASVKRWNLRKASALKDV